MSVLLATALGIGAVTVPVQAAEGDPQYLTVAKTVNGDESRTLEPGEPFTYQIEMNCSEADCVDAVVEDALPEELEGFQITGVEVTSSNSPVAGEATWTEGGTPVSQPSTVGAATALTVAFSQSLASGGTGLAIGSTATVNITLQVPIGFSPDDERNGEAIVNTAVTSADNSAGDSDAATVTVSATQELAAAIDKTWSPASSAFAPGAESTITLAATNTSNVSVDSMTVEEPDGLADGATALSADNPFRTNDFARFADGATLPNGATSVRVDALVLAGGVWTWTEGVPGDSYALPAGVAPGDVGGLRLTYTGEISPQAGATVPIALTQRAADRNDAADLSTQSITIDNVARAWTSRDGASSDVVTDTAARTVTPAVVSTDIAKSFADAEVVAGGSTTATITARNTGTAVNTWTIRDVSGFFTDSISFGGFTGGITYPADAVGGTVVYHMLDGSLPDESVPFGSGTIPDAPSGRIAGFDLVFASAEGTNGIAADASVSASFTVDAVETADRDTTYTNTATSTVTAANGQEGDDSASATLSVPVPSIDTELAKTVRPRGAVEPGQSVLTTLTSTTSTNSASTKVRTILVEDAWDGADATNFWNAFGLTSIAPTQVLAGTDLTVQVQTEPGAWVTLDTAGAQNDAHWYSLDSDELAAMLGAQSLSTAAVTGIRFTFTSTAEDGFGLTTTFAPNLVFTARATLRTGGPVDTAQEGEGATQVPTSYTNTATTTGSGTTGGGAPLSDGDTGTGIGQVVTYPGEGTGVRIDKAWNADVVTALTDAQASTTLTWGIQPGHDSVTLTDDPSSSVRESVFDAFNLTAVKPVGSSTAPYTNGWYLAYDTVTAVELYDGSAWVPVTAPDGSWQEADGSFKGYTLSADEQTHATGVRVTLEPDDAARADALAAGTIAPEPGSGVASGNERTFTLDWKLRDRTRSSNAWITSTTALNTADGGVDRNTAEIRAGEGSDTDSDTIVITGGIPKVVVDKTVATPKVQVPADGASASQDYPTNRYTLTARNGSTAGANYVRVGDPAPCTDEKLMGCSTGATGGEALADPFTGTGAATGVLDDAVPNAFERQDLTKITIAAEQEDQVDWDGSIVWLLRYDAETGAYTTTSTTIAAANGLAAGDLADVVGVSVTFAGAGASEEEGSITQDNDLTITLDTRVRPTLRSTGQAFWESTDEGHASDNGVFAQSYDLVVSPGVTTGDFSNAPVSYTKGVLEAKASKTISDGTIVEPDPDESQTVTLAGNQGASTVSPTSVTITDLPDGGDGGSTGFWENFSFTGLSSLTVPAGADRVRIGVFGTFDEGGAPAWLDGEVQPTSEDGTYTLPVAEERYGDIQGLRIVFTRDDGALFSQSSPAWSAQAVYTVALRDTQRTSGEDVAWPGTATDAASVSSVSTGFEPASATAADDVSWNAGSAVLAIDKWANEGTRTVKSGATIPWDLTISNAGTGFLDLTSVVDDMDEYLIYTGEGGSAAPDQPIQFTPGTLPDGTPGAVTTAPEVEATGETNGTITFTWPGGARLLPGETITIRVWLEFLPGASSGEKVSNALTVNTGQRLDAVTRALEGTTNQTPRLDSDGTSGTTSDFVQPAEGENVYVVKGVQGSIAGAVNSVNPDLECVASMPSPLDPSDRYYRNPCVANSTLGGTDKWMLRAVNGGTTDLTRMIIFDQLPVAGDQLLLSGTGRGSQYRPELTGAPVVVGAPDGTTTTVEVTTSTGVCVGTWAGLGGGAVGTAQAPCAQNGEEWSPAGEDTDWSKVTGLRVTLDFTASDIGALKPGVNINVMYSSANAPQTEADSSLALRDVPAADQYAWNQFGVQYFGAGQTPQAKKITPSQVGVHLRTGSIKVAKTAAGDARAYAPDSITATVTCEAGGAPLTFDGGASSKTVTLTRDEDGAYAPATIDGIPVGANCEVSEDGDPGAFGETARSIENQALQVATADPVDEAPAAQVATITNSYQWGALSVTKQVDTEADAGRFGPFGFALACTTADGQPVDFGEGRTGTSFTLPAGGTWTAPGSTIPARSTCVLTETDSSSADATVLTGDNVTDNGDGTATIVIGSDDTAVVSALVTNHYDAGTLTVSKTVEGPGAATYGSGPFGFHSICTYGDQTLLDEDYTLEPGATKTFGVFPAGTQCQTAETATSGATSTAMSPEGGVATIAAQTGALPSSVEVRATNTYDVGGLKVVKQVAGSGAEAFGAGPFTAQVACAYQKDGETVAVPLANDGTVVLDQANGYEATVENIIAGAECTVTETDGGGADASVVSPEDGAVTVGGSQDAAAEVTITNTFEAGYVTVLKAVDGDGASAYGTGEFGFEAVCDWPSGTGAAGSGGSETTEFTLAAGGSRRLGPYPVGAQCRVTETATSGATSTTMSPEGGVVAVEPSGEADTASEATVTATNTFDTAALTIVKKRTGAGADALGDGPFTAQVACTYSSDGQTTDVALPDGGTVVLSKDNRYRATIGGILVGAECTVTETDAGGADATTIDPLGGVVTIDADGQTVTITNEFATAPSGGGTGLSVTGADVGYLMAAAIALAVGGALAAGSRTRKRKGRAQYVPR
jgi:fimbrial isopeptide formation D2 family protein